MSHITTTHYEIPNFSFSSLFLPFGLVWSPPLELMTRHDDFRIPLEFGENSVECSCLCWCPVENWLTMRGASV